MIRVHWLFITFVLKSGVSFSHTVLSPIGEALTRKFAWKYWAVAPHLYIVRIVCARRVDCSFIIGHFPCLWFEMVCPHNIG